ncbi:DUF6706 family protein [Bergeyella zoohelcum]|uniref:DUF6706 family protein n=1 Tax=Bergeyella zoohelcum TaxID=1015 RepID=UPI00373557C0
MSVSVSDYFKRKVGVLGVNISEEYLEVFMISNNINSLEYVTPTSVKELDKKFLEIIRMILIMPDITEDDYSVKYDRKALKEWYSAECVRLGVPNLIDKGIGVVKDMSHLA